MSCEGQERPTGSLYARRLEFRLVVALPGILLATALTSSVPAAQAEGPDVPAERDDTPRSRAYTFTSIVDENGPFEAFHPPSVNNAGTVGFFAATDAGVDGVYTSDGTTTTTIVDDTGPLGFWGGGFSLACFPAINDAGQVAFFAYTDNWSHGVYRGAGGAITTIAQADDGVFSEAFDNPGINNLGQVAFRGTFVGGTEGIFLGDGGTAVTIADSDGIFDWFYDGNDVNDGGQVAFMAGNSTADTGVYVADGSRRDPPVTIANTAGPYSSFGTWVSINNAGVAAFTAELDAGGRGVFAGDGTMTTTIADNSGAFDAFDEPAINNAGDVAFRAELDDGGHGIYVGADPVADKVIAYGDALFGSTVTQLEFFHFGHNDAGQIAFVYSLDDGQYGIAVATPEQSLPGDCDGDGYVDFDDFVALSGCLDGPDIPAGAGCACADLNGDDDIDLADVWSFQLAFTGE
jgi:hypothetical protein